MKQWTPELVIALVIIIGCFVLIATGINGEVKSIFAMTCGWVVRAAFGKFKEVKNGRN